MPGHSEQTTGVGDRGVKTCALPPRGTHRSAESVVAEQFRECGGERGRVARLDEPPGHAVLYDFGQSRGPCGDDRQPGRHGLDDDDAERFLHARMAEAVRSGILARELHLVDTAEKIDATGDPEDIGEPAESGELRPIADDSDPGVGQPPGQQWNRPEQVGCALARVLTTHREDRGLSVGRTGSVEQRFAAVGPEHRFRYDGDVFGNDAVPARGDSRGVATRYHDEPGPPGVRPLEGGRQPALQDRRTSLMIGLIRGDALQEYDEGSFRTQGESIQIHADHEIEGMEVALPQPEVEGDPVDETLPTASGSRQPIDAVAERLQAARESENGRRCASAVLRLPRP